MISTQGGHSQAPAVALWGWGRRSSKATASSTLNLAGTGGRAAQAGVAVVIKQFFNGGAARWAIACPPNRQRLKAAFPFSQVAGGGASLPAYWRSALFGSRAQATSGPTRTSCCPLWRSCSATKPLRIFSLRKARMKRAPARRPLGTAIAWRISVKLSSSTR